MTAAAHVLGVATLLMSVATLIATAVGDDRSLPRLVRARRGCAAVAALLVVAGGAGLVSGIGLGAACVAAVISVHAIWLAMAGPPPPLETCLDRLTSGGETAWQAEFERPFDEYVRKRTPEIRRLRS